MKNLCPCGSKIDYDNCCRPFIKGESAAPTSEKLMRSRYSAYVKKDIDYLYKTLHSTARADFDPKATRDWAENNKWQGLQILKTIAGDVTDSEGSVEFVASFTENGKDRKHHEISHFKKEAGRWYYVDEKRPENKPFMREASKVGRNDSCPCGSGKKYKKCCAFH